MSNVMKVDAFGQINLGDSFFDSLKEDYPGFDQWFAKKAAASEKAYVIRDDAGKVEGFLYMKRENGTVDDVDPPLPPANRIKIGTFKVDGHGTKIGERFLKKVFDQAIARQVDEVYVTVFAKHTGLTRLFDKHGFTQVGQKSAANGEAELVMLRDMRFLSGDSVMDYPFIHVKDRRKYLLAIYPQFHTQLLPDSILKTETFDVVRDLSHTNSIHKVYVCQMPVESLRAGDALVMYRTKAEDDLGAAEYRSVATSICVVEDARRASSFATEADFLLYCEPYSVFSIEELKGFYADRSKTRVIKFTYNAAMTKRLIRKVLIEDVGIAREQRWGFIPLTNEQFQSIVELGGVSEDLIVD